MISNYEKDVLRFLMTRSDDIFSILWNVPFVYAKDKPNFSNLIDLGLLEKNGDIFFIRDCKKIQKLFLL